MTYIPYLGTFFFSRYPSVALARNKYYYLSFFPYDGYYSKTDRTGTVQKTIPSLKCEASIQRPPHYHDVCLHVIMATCLYKSALLVAELDSCLHP